MVYINDNYKFIFIENPKSGSTSILKALERALKIKIKRETSPSMAHMTVDQVKNMCPEKWSSYLKVSTFRDPFKRFCSSINYRLHQQKNYRTEEDLVRHLKNPNRCPYCRKQEDYTKECDFLIRLDTIQSDFDTFCNKIGISSVKVEKENSSTYRKKSYELNFNYQYLYEKIRQ